MTDILIMGGGIAGNLAAAYFRRNMPELDIVVVNRSDKRGPIVGESLIEVSTNFIRDLGLSSMLVEKHYPKYGLTYYYKLNLDDPSDRSYVVDESPSIPPFPSFQINRFTFDRDLQLHNAAAGVTFCEGRVVQVELGQQRHKVVIEDAAKGRSELSCRWLIDASGRNHVLSKRLGLLQRPQFQKDVFWFRLVDFNPEILSRIRAIKKENRGFDSYYCTHHFFGKGNWIWCIPMRPEEGDNMISIGITYRTDIYPHTVRTVEQFMQFVGEEHEVVVDLVRSGRIADVNYYGSYMYESNQHYSADGWFIIGDAGDTVDPLYSLGVSLITIQIRQVEAIINKARQAEEIEEFTNDLDTLYQNFHRLVTHEITRLYGFMHDSYRCHLMMHVSIMGSFHLGAPVILNGYMWDPIGAKLINKLASPAAIEADLKPLRRLIGEVASRPANRTISNYVKVQSFFSINYKFFEYLREEDIPQSIWEMYFYLVGFRLRLLRRIGWRGLTAFDQHLAVMKDLVRGILLRVLFNQTKLRDNMLIRRLLATPDARKPSPIVTSGEAKSVANTRSQFS